MTIHCPNCGVGFELEDGTGNRAVCPLCSHEFQVESDTAPAGQPVSAPSLAEETDSVVDDVLVSVAAGEPPAKQAVPQEISEPLPKIHYTEPPSAKRVPREPAALTESQEMLLDLSVRSARKDASQEIGIRKIPYTSSPTADIAAAVPQISAGEPPARKGTEPPRVVMTQEFGQVTEAPMAPPEESQPVKTLFMDSLSVTTPAREPEPRTPISRGEPDPEFPFRNQPPVSATEPEPQTVAQEPLPALEPLEEETLEELEPLVEEEKQPDIHTASTMEIDQIRSKPPATREVPPPTPKTSADVPQLSESASLLAAAISGMDTPEPQIAPEPSSSSVSSEVSTDLPAISDTQAETLPAVPTPDVSSSQSDMHIEIVSETGEVFQAKTTEKVTEKPKIESPSSTSRTGQMETSFFDKKEAVSRSQYQMDLSDTDFSDLDDHDAHREEVRKFAIYSSIIAGIIVIVAGGLAYMFYLKSEENGHQASAAIYEEEPAEETVSGFEQAANGTVDALQEEAPVEEPMQEAVAVAEEIDEGALAQDEPEPEPEPEPEKVVKEDVKPEKKTPAEPAELSEDEKKAKASEHLIAGNNALQKGKFDSALKEYKSVLKYFPQSSGAYMGIGSVYASTGKDEKARNAYQKALDYDPNGPQAAQLRQILGVE